MNQSVGKIELKNELGEGSIPICGYFYLLTSKSRLNMLKWDLDVAEMGFGRAEMGFGHAEMGFGRC